MNPILFVNSIYKCLITHSRLIDEDVVVMRTDSPVLRHVVLVTVVLLVVSEEVVELDGLLEVFNCFETSDMLEEVEVSKDVDTSLDKSVPVDGLELDIGVVLLELPSDGLAEVDVWSLDALCVFSGHFELAKVEVFWEHLHCLWIKI